MTEIELLSFLKECLGDYIHTYKRNYAFYSPFKEHRKPKLEINLDVNQYGDHDWHCWISNERGGSIRSLLQKVHVPEELQKKLPRILKSKIVGSTVNDLDKIVQSLNRVDTNINTKSTLTLPKEFIPVREEDTFQYRKVMQFLRKRNLSDWDIKSYNIGYCVDGRYNERIIIPSYDANYNLNYFVSRLYIPKEDVDNYKNSNVDQTDVIGFESRINWNLPVLLAEGALDAIALRHNAIPLFGKNMSSRLKSYLIHAAEEIYICLDSDALDTSQKICEELQSYGKKVYRVNFKEKDPSLLGYEKSWEIIKNTTDLSLKDMIKFRLFGE